MATITLPSEVLLEVLKCVPYENGSKLAETSKSWTKLLQLQLREQLSAIKTEIRRLESTDLGEKYRRFKSTYKRLVDDESRISEDFKVRIKDARGISAQQDAIALFNQRLQAIQTSKYFARIQFRANARKRQPIIDKIESLKSKLDQSRKPEAELADLERRRMCYGIAMFVTLSLGWIVLGAPIILIIDYLISWEKIPLYGYILSIVSGIGLAVVLPLLVLTYMKLDGVYGQLDLKASRYENKKYIS